MLYQKKEYPKNGLETSIIYARHIIKISECKGITKYVKRQLNKRHRSRIKRYLKNLKTELI